MKFLRVFLLSLSAICVAAALPVSSTNVHVSVNVDMGMGGEHSVHSVPHKSVPIASPSTPSHLIDVSHCASDTPSGPYDGLFIDFPEDDCEKLSLYRKYHAHHERNETDYSCPQSHPEGQEEFSEWVRHAEEIHHHNTGKDTKDSSYFMRMHPMGHLPFDQFWHQFGLSHQELMSFTDWHGKLPIHPDFAEGQSAMDSAGFVPAGSHPSSLDWRARGAVTSVKNQGNCGSCWAHGTVVAMEGLYWRLAGHVKDLSSQQLIDCDNGFFSKYFGEGCRGHTGESAFDWVKENGICSQADYPYLDVNVPKAQWGRPLGIHECKTSCRPALHISGFSKIPENEAAIIAALQKGPVEVRIHADRSVQSYGGGILNSPCNIGVTKDTPFYHIVAIVGYTPEAWIVKNSWSVTWGEAGYMRFARGKNQCAINDCVLQPY